MRFSVLSVLLFAFVFDCGYSSGSNYSPEAARKRLKKLNRWKPFESKMPFKSNFKATSRCVTRMSTKDMRNQEFTPKPGFQLHDPRQVTMSTAPASLFAWFMQQPETETTWEHCVLQTPREDLLILKCGENARCLAQRKLRPVNSSNVFSKACNWLHMNIWSAINSNIAHVRFLDAPNTLHAHPLVVDYCMLKFIQGQRIGVKPMYLSPPVNLSPGTSVKRRFLVMEHHGMSLREFIGTSSNVPIPILATLQIALEIAKSLRKIHSQGIVHGNLSMDTVVFTKSNNVDEGIRLRDFSEALLDPRGLHEQALADLRSLFLIMCELNVGIGELVKTDSQRTNSESTNHLSLELQDLYNETSQKFIVSDVDYSAIIRSLQNSIALVSAV